jgi:tetraacyldisaccharide 4'-kinase
VAVKPHTAWRERLTRAWLQRGLLAWLLWPLSVLLGGLSALRRQLYRVGWFKAERVPVPVIVVGNVLAGGSGKTPVVMAMVAHLVARGLKVGVISRGYGRQTTDCREVTSDCAVTDVGDEPALIKHATHVPVFVSVRRIEAAKALLARYPETQVILSDDGLQHLGMHRDLEICVFDDRGVGNGFLLPAGPLREPWPRPVDWVLHTGTQAAFAGFKAPRALAPFARRIDGSVVPLVDLTNNQGQPLMALAAIAKPEDFFTMLRADGLTLARTLALPDHYDFNSWSADNSKGYTLMCTEKDAVKLWHHQPNALAVPLVLALAPDFLTQLDAKLAKNLHSL